MDLVKLKVHDYTVTYSVHTLMELGATTGRNVFSIFRILSLSFRLFRFNYIENSLGDLSEFQSQISSKHMSCSHLIDPQGF